MRTIAGTDTLSMHSETLKKQDYQASREKLPMCTVTYVGVISNITMNVCHSGTIMHIIGVKGAWVCLRKEVYVEGKLWKGSEVCAPFFLRHTCNLPMPFLAWAARKSPCSQTLFFENWQVPNLMCSCELHPAGDSVEARTYVMLFLLPSPIIKMAFCREEEGMRVWASYLLSSVSGWIPPPSVPSVKYLLALCSC